jgi:folate-binding protein YgfZ
VLPRLLDPRVIEALRIERLLPVWDRELNGETLPPEVGFDRTHIDYDRGCYPGQETISRIKSIGRVNRLLCRLDPSPGSIPNPEGNLSAGMPLLNEKGNEISVITSASFQWDTGAWVALAILPRALFENREPLFAFDPLTGDKTPLSIVEIPGS